jgi:N-acetylglutamate synthase-like GNAT family acetyltransferase
VSDSQFEGQGAGSVLLQWGLDKAESEQLPVYLESTLESSSFYEKRGFKQVAEMNVALDECETWIYHEVGLLWEP